MCATGLGGSVGSANDSGKHKAGKGGMLAEWQVMHLVIAWLTESVYPSRTKVPLDQSFVLSTGIFQIGLLLSVLYAAAGLGETVRILVS